MHVQVCTCVYCMWIERMGSMNINVFLSKIYILYSLQSYGIILEKGRLFFEQHTSAGFKYFFGNKLNGTITTTKNYDRSLTLCAYKLLNIL